MFGLRQVLAAVGDKGKVRVEELRKRMGVSESSLKRYLYELRRYGLARVDGGVVEVDMRKAEAVLAVLEERPDALKKVADLLAERGVMVKVKEVRTTSPSSLLAVYGVDRPSEEQVKLVFKMLSDGYDGLSLLVPVPRYYDIVSALLDIARSMNVEYRTVSVNGGKLIVIEVPDTTSPS